MRDMGIIPPHIKNRPRESMAAPSELKTQLWCCSCGEITAEEKCPLCGLFFHRKEPTYTCAACGLLMCAEELPPFCPECGIKLLL